MRKLRDVLRLRLQAELSMRQIRDSLRISLGRGSTGKAAKCYKDACNLRLAGPVELVNN